MIAWMIDNPSLAGAAVWFVSLLTAWVINWAIITQAYKPRAIGPWSPVPARMPARTFADWLPIVGWWRLRREESIHGERYWLRPFLIELTFPLAMLALYRWEVMGGTLFVARLATNLQPELHGQFLGHFVLITAMMVATFIDFDEHLIPDSVTLPGTVLGLIGSVVLPGWFLFIPAGMSATELHANSSGSWPTWLDGQTGLVLAILIISLYCFGLLDRVWITRRGLGKAWQYFWAMMFRSRWWIIVAAVWLLLVGWTFYVWSSQATRWSFYMSALIGLAASGGYTWLMRIAAKQGLGVEALGFGDVTLMAMIGVYVGWQPSVIIFFVAPCYAVVVFLLRMLIQGSNAGAYGPFLCMATATVLVFWDYFRGEYTQAILELPPWVTFAILACTLLMLVGILKLYRAWRGLHRAFERRSNRRLNAGRLTLELLYFNPLSGRRSTDGNCKS